jgi:hypothetical protein
VDASLEGAWAEQATDPLAPAGALTAEAGGGSWVARLGASRRLRAPNLLETDGTKSFDLPGTFTLTRLPAGRLPFEVHDHLRAALVHRSVSTVVEAGVERWMLRDGIGWRPATPAAVSGEAFTVGGLSYDLDQMTASVRRRWGGASHGLAVAAHGNVVLGELPRDASRGGGWPKRSLLLTLRWWHDLLSPRDQIRVFYRLRHQGAHWDDLLVPYSEPGEFVAATTRHDLRLALDLRDAELYLEVRNLLDAELVEVTGTRRRGRDLLWGLVWPFIN